MSLLRVSQLKELVETDLDDPALQRLLDDAEDEILRLFGEHSSQVDYLQGGEEYLFLTRVAGSISEIVESIGDTDTALETDDYESYYGGRALRRLSDGTNQRTTWGERLKVTYTPSDDTNIRNRVQADLVKLAIQYDALKSEKAGNYSRTVVDYEAERESILSRLRPRHRLFI